MIYCRTCDLGFCGRHLQEHDLMPSMQHDVVDAREMISHVPCCVCSGILKPKEQR